MTPDAPPDVALDAAPDVAPDAAPDATPDAAPDAAPDVAPDASPIGSLVRVVGELGGPGNLDGVGAEVRFSSLNHLAGDGARYLYTIERCAVRRVDTAAAYAVTTFAGDPLACGAVDGPRATARFNGLSQVVADGTRALYLTEASVHRIRKLDLVTGAVTTLAGVAGEAGTADGPLAAARFNQPRGLALVGRALFVGDEGNATLRRIDLDANTVSTVAGLAGTRALLDGTGAAARFTQPSWLATDGATRILVAEPTTNTLRSVALPSYEVTTVAGAPGGPTFMDGVGAAARFNFPFGVAFAGPDVAVLADQQNAALRRIDLTTRAVTTFVGGRDVVDGDAMTARVYGPYSPAVQGGVAYFPDFNGTVLRGLTIATGEVRTYAATARRLAGQLALNSLTVGGGTVYASRQGTIDTFDPATGAFTTLVGDPAVLTTVDGVGAAARLYGAASLAYGDGALYWYEQPRYVVRRLDLATRTVTTLAGTAGMSGSVDGVGAAARFDTVGTITYADGAVYVAESNLRVIRRVDVATRAVTTVAGARYETQSVDGVGTAARFRFPVSMVSDGAGAIYVCDETTLRRLDVRDFRVTTLAGSTAEGYVDAVGAAARFRNFLGAAAWEPGFVYLADGSNHAVRRFEVATGRVTTVLGRPGLAGVRTGPLPTSLSGPSTLISLGPGDLLLRDENAILRARGFVPVTVP